MRKYILCVETFLTFQIFIFQFPKNNEVPEYILFTAHIIFLALQSFLSHPQKYFRVPQIFFWHPQNFFDIPQFFFWPS